MSSSEASAKNQLVCHVCVEPRGEHETATIASCLHQSCKPCLRQYLQLSIDRGLLSPTCFHTVEEAAVTTTSTCGGILTEYEIRSIVDSDTFRKFKRFQFIRKHPVFGRQCPHCDHLQVWPHGLQQHQCKCEACGDTFCFVHGSAHGHQSRDCEAYEEATRQREKPSLAIIQTVAKYCPGCGIPVEKDDGCNHMTCLHCGTSFCWICLALVDRSLTPQHYQGWRLGGCAGLQYAKVDAFSRRYLVRRAILRGVSTLAVGVPALVVTVLVTIATLGWLPLIRYYRVTFSEACSVCFEISAAGIRDSYIQIGEGLTRRSSEARGGIQRLFRSKQSTNGLQ